MQVRKLHGLQEGPAIMLKCIDGMSGKLVARDVMVQWKVSLSLARALSRSRARSLSLSRSLALSLARSLSLSLSLSPSPSL